MTIYGENEFQFRPAPSALALFSASSALLLLCAEVANALSGALYLLIARVAGLVAPMAWTAPFLASPRLPYFASPPLGPIYLLAAPIVFVVSAIIAVGLVHLWPTDQRLSIRLFMHAMALSLVLAGCLAPAFEKGAFDGLTQYGPVPPVVWMLLFVVLGAWLALHIERQTVVLLGNVFGMTMPLQRIRRWALRIPFPFLLLAAISLLGGFRAGAYASAVVVAATLLENISRRPREHYELVLHPEMREAAATLPIVGAIVIAAAIFAFGFPALDGHSRAAVFSMKGVTFENAREVRERHPLKLDLIKTRDKREGATDSEIYIRWSKDRGKAKPQVGGEKRDEKQKK